MPLFNLDESTESNHTNRLIEIANENEKSDVYLVIHKGKLYKVDKFFSDISFLDIIANINNDLAYNYRSELMVYNEKKNRFDFLYKNYFDEKLALNGPKRSSNDIIFKTSSNNGLILYADGDYYKGSLLNGSRNENGHGIYGYSDGSFEFGDFLYDELYCENGTKTTRDGVIENGMFVDGELISGEKKYSNGGFEKGNFSNGKLECENGIKTIERDLIVFNGTFEDGELISGEKKYSNGDFEKGNFSNGKLNCKNGIKAIERGLITFNGTFVSGEFISGIKKDWKENVELNGKFENETLTGKKGVKLFPNGLKYRGEFKNDRLNGFGIKIFPNSTSLKGTFKDDQVMFGEVEYKDEVGTIYKGTLEDGGAIGGYEKRPLGSGVCFEGKQDKSKFDGFGEIFDNNKSQYICGNFKNMKLDGEAMCKESDYLIFGEFKDGTFISGEKKYFNGDVEIGFFLENQLHSKKGIKETEGGLAILLGEFEKGRFIHGEKHYAQGNIKLIGNFENEALTGKKGVKLFPNGLKYKGEFKNDRLNGLGTKIFPNNTSLKGTFEDDQVVFGEVEYKDEVGTIYKGTLEDGGVVGGYQKKHFSETSCSEGIKSSTHHFYGEQFNNHPQYSYCFSESINDIPIERIMTISNNPPHILTLTEFEDQKIKKRGVVYSYLEYLKKHPISERVREYNALLKDQGMYSSTIKSQPEISLKESYLEAILGNFDKKKRKNIFEGFEKLSTSSNIDMSILPARHYKEYGYFKRQIDEDSSQTLDKRALAFMSVINPVELKNEQGASIQEPQPSPFLGEASIAQTTAQGQDSDIEDKTIDYKKFGATANTPNVPQVEIDQSVTKKSAQANKNNAKTIR